MRETLTVIAGLLLIALVTALIGPRFVAWEDHRDRIDAELSTIIGQEVVTTGVIRVGLLPTPILAIDGLRVGSADPAASSLVANRLVAELELGPLLRGELVLARVELDGARLSATVKDGAIRFATRERRPAATPQGARLVVIKRSVLEMRTPEGDVLASYPAALEARLPQLGGPWRVEGEVAGRSLRIVTGDRDAEGRIRARLGLVSAPFRLDFDGWVAPLVEGGRWASSRPASSTSRWSPPRAASPC